METMELFVLDTDFQAIGILENYQSLLWVDRYSDVGDFEIYTPMNFDLLDLLQKDRYLSYLKSEHLMIIESVQIETDIENGNYILIEGRSLESILARRIIWNQTNVSGSLQDAIKQLITENIISPAIAERKIDNFIFEDSTDDRILALTCDAQYTGDSLLDVIISLCDSNEIGFKVTLNDANQFVFKLYKGVDRSYDQSDYPYVIFSSNFDNIINSTYIDDSREYHNVALVAGEGEGSDRKTVVVGEDSGLTRREFYADARDISTTTDSGTLSPAEYNEKLKQRGEEELTEWKKTETFEGEVDYDTQFILNEDYFIGDVVQVENEYNIQGIATIIEIIRSNDSEGFKITPKFSEMKFNVGDPNTTGGNP